jgi:hypothetical protein
MQWYRDSVDLMVLTKALYKLMHPSYIKYMHNLALYTYLNLYCYMYPHWKALQPMFMVSLGSGVQRRWNARKNSEDKHFEANRTH